MQNSYETPQFEMVTLTQDSSVAAEGYDDNYAMGSGLVPPMQ